nr:hypothetical protein CFP56_11604 [Quercus suber]
MRLCQPGCDTITVNFGMMCARFSYQPARKVPSREESYPETASQDLKGVQSSVCPVRSRNAAPRHSLRRLIRPRLLSLTYSSCRLDRTMALTTAAPMTGKFQILRESSLASDHAIEKHTGMGGDTDARARSATAFIRYANTA